MRQILIGILAFIILATGVLVFSKFSNNEKRMRPQRPKMTPTAFVKPLINNDIPILLPASGRLLAKNRIKLYSEVQGVLEYGNKEFKAGVKYSKGETLVKMNSEEFFTNLLAQKSSFHNLMLTMMPDIRLDFPESFPNWQKYLENFDINNPIPELPEPESEKERLFVSAKGIYTNFYTIKNLEVKLAKYSLKAPYNGILTEAFITPGTLVSPGQAIGEFVDPSVYELEVAVSSSMISKLNVGDAVRVEDLENKNEVYEGEIIRINGKVDQNTQTVKVFIELKDKRLQEGQYLRAILESKSINNIVEIPRNLLVNKSNLYVVQDSALVLKNVDVLHQGEENIMVQGLQNGELLLWKPIPKAFSGMKVEVRGVETD